MKGVGGGQGLCWVNSRSLIHNQVRIQLSTPPLIPTQVCEARGIFPVTTKAAGGCASQDHTSGLVGVSGGLSGPRPCLSHADTVSDTEFPTQSSELRALPNRAGVASGASAQESRVGRGCELVPNRSNQKRKISWKCSQNSKKKKKMEAIRWIK